MTKWQIGNRVFSDWSDVEDFLKENEEFSIEDVIELSEEDEPVIQESNFSKEEPIEEGAISEEDKELVENLPMIIKNWDNLDITEEEKKLFIASIFNSLSGSTKKLAENTGTVKAVEASVLSTLEKLSSPESRVCPFCSREVSREEISTENNVMAKILHAKKEHKETLSAYLKIVGFTKDRDAFESEEPTREEPESGPLMPHQKGSPNPEQCSREELASEIIKSEELKEALYKRWLQSLKERKDVV